VPNISLSKIYLRRKDRDRIIKYNFEGRWDAILRKICLEDALPLK
jgi:hypothetical protein